MLAPMAPRGTTTGLEAASAGATSPSTVQAATARAPSPRHRRRPGRLASLRAAGLVPREVIHILLGTPRHRFHGGPLRSDYETSGEGNKRHHRVPSGPGSRGVP